MDNGDAHPMNIDDESDDSVEEIGKPTQSEGVAIYLEAPHHHRHHRKLISKVWDYFVLIEQDPEKPDQPLVCASAHLNDIFVRDNNCTVQFDAFGFSIKDFMTRMMLLRCDSTGDLYPVRKPSPLPHAFLISQHTWHQRLGHPGSEVLCCLISRNFILCNKEKPLVLWHASRAASIG
ncbi:hypothetical protein Tco_0887080 [Tanacetum coccineum]